MTGGVDPALMARWTTGWALARGLPPPSPIEGGFYLHVGLPEQRGRYVFPALDPPRLRALAQQVAGDHVVLKVCAPGEAAARAAPAPWALGEPRFMMEAPLDAEADDGAADPPAGYRMTVSRDGATTVAAVTDSAGETVARAGLVVVDGVAILDRVGTDERHRRRGLGRLVVRTLQTEAVRRGAARGVLSATVTGRLLYAGLGWRVLSDYTTLALPAAG